MDELNVQELGESATRLRNLPAIDILQWAADRYGRRLAFATAFGPAGCVLIDLIGRHGLTVDVFTLDTGLFFDETYALWETLETRYELTIRGVTPATTLEAQADAYGDRLWERNPDLCCAIRKIAPIKAELSRVDAWISSIRRAQTPQRAHAQVVEWDKRFMIAKINPLVRWTQADVWRYIRDHAVPHNPLHDQGYPSIGCRPCTSPVAPGEDERAGRWRNRAKNECGLHGLQAPSNGELIVRCAAAAPGFA